MVNDVVAEKISGRLHKVSKPIFNIIKNKC